MAKIILFLFIFMGLIGSAPSYAGPGDPGIGLPEIGSIDPSGHTPRPEPKDPMPSSGGGSGAQKVFPKVALVDPGPLPAPFRKDPQDPGIPPPFPRGSGNQIIQVAINDPGPLPTEPL